MFASIDSPTTPQNRGLDYFYLGITDELIQSRRELMLGASREELIGLSEKYLLQNLKNNDSTRRLKK